MFPVPWSAASGYQGVMFFYASKIAWFLAKPGNLLLILLVVGTVLLWTRWRRTGRWLSAGAVTLGVAVAVLPLGHWLWVTLENRFPSMAETPEGVDGIVVLGGVVNQYITKARGQAAIGGAVERLTAFAELALRYPDAKLIFSGGSGFTFRQELKESHYVGPVFGRLGLQAGRVVYEDRSRNTAENAEFSRLAARPQPGETWLLVTSAFHMPRAVGSFRRAGWKVVPYPVDYATDGSFETPSPVDFVAGIGSLDGALHEWIGLAVYRLSGKTDAFFPAPGE